MRAVLAAWIAAVLAAGAGVAVRRAGDHPWPGRWDSRVLPYVKVVERERGLRYKHPVKVELLGDDAFEGRMGGDRLSDEDQAQLQQYEGIFRALGLVQGDVDLRAAAQRLGREAVIGLYLPDRDEMLIRGDRITLSMQPTIVHELTHALQAQHFDLEPKHLTSGEEIAYRALVEADALRVEDAYVQSLPEDQQSEIDDARRAQANDADIDSVPPVLTELFSFPYVLGPTFVSALVQRSGDAGINRAFRQRPRTDQDIAQPSVYLAGRKPTPVDVPPLQPGEIKAGDAEEFGMVSLLLVLGERVPFPDAWDAVRTWRGDNSITYRSAGKDCIRVRVDSSDVSRLAAVAHTWAAAHAATVEVIGDNVQLSSCDPGTSGPAPTPGVTPRPFDVLAARAQLLTILLDERVDEGVAECGVDALIRAETPGRFVDVLHTDDETDPRVAAFRDELTRSLRGCGGPTS